MVTMRRFFRLLALVSAWMAVPGFARPSWDPASRKKYALRPTCCNALPRMPGNRRITSPVISPAPRKPKTHRRDVHREREHMKIATGLLLVISACGIAQAAQPGEADPPTSTATPGAPQSTATAQGAQSTSDAAAKKKTTKVVLVDNEVNDQQLKQILAQGYRPEGHGDKVLYCRSEAQVGTRFRTKTCRTSTRILADEQSGKELTQGVQRDLGNETGK